MIPVDLKLYNKIKEEVSKQYKKPSAYRNGQIVKKYKSEFKKKYKNKKPYKGVKDENKGLSRWFKESWRNSRGGVGYKYKSDVYRPTKRINKQTPKTFDELTPGALKKARREKKNKGRVKKF